MHARLSAFDTSKITEILQYTHVIHMSVYYSHARHIKLLKCQNARNNFVIRLTASDISTATEIILITSDTAGCYYHSLTRLLFVTFGKNKGKATALCQR
jgi:hypothetical protein